MLSQMMSEGKIVPSSITIGLLKNSIEQTTDTDTFLIDGFPRNINQGQEFENSITKCKFVIFLDAPQDIMTQRILKRAGDSGEAVRNDDNLASLQKVCFETFGFGMVEINHLTFLAIYYSLRNLYACY